MKVRNWQKAVVIGGALTFVGGFIMCCSGLHLPFLMPRAALRGYLKTDFGIGLPSGTVVEKSYWVGARDPEEDFQFQIPPAQMVSFIGDLKSGAAVKGCDIREDQKIAYTIPFYGAPQWWNNPPLADAVPLEILISKDGEPFLNYRLVYSLTTGKVYLSCGGF